MVRLDGDLDPDTGESVLTALRAHQDAEARGSGAGDDRTPDQRMADALGEICRRFLDLGHRPVVGGERPHLTVTVDLEALEGRGDGAPASITQARWGPRPPGAWGATRLSPGS